MAAVSRPERAGCLAAEIETCSNSAVTPAVEAASGPESTLARSQAERRRRVLAATLDLAANGGFDAVQMRDVAAAADVALGTVYRYFSSKERLLLEAMAEQQSDLRAYIETHPLLDETPAKRVMSVLRRSNRSLKQYPDVTAAMVRAFGSAQHENADIVRRVTELMTAIITRAVQGTERHTPTDREVRVARILMQVWLSSLNGWVCGVDGPERVDEDLEAAANLLLS
jgi:TetR/AcrR family transcriptional regulator, cholesterol catabolism regulator